MSSELYKRHRPKTLSEVVGQPDAVRTLQKFKDVPHAILFTGPSGTGKTTLARIMAEKVGAVGRFDLQEVNCGTIDEPSKWVRQLEADMTGGAIQAKARGWILDEVQSLSRARFAQEALLKILEDMPDHVYFFLCTTDPKKILPTIRNRCSEVVCKTISDKEILGLIQKVAKLEKASVGQEVLDKIVECAAGSARKSLVELEKIIGMDDDEERMSAVGTQGLERAAFDLVKALMPWRGAPVWDEVAKVLKDIEEEEPEGLRQMVLASARSTLLNPKTDLRQKAHAAKVIDRLRDQLWDKNSGRAILAAECFAVVYAKS